MPRSASESLPVMSYEMFVGEDSEDCSNVMVPETLESPRRTATVGHIFVSKESTDERTMDKKNM